METVFSSWSALKLYSYKDDMTWKGRKLLEDVTSDKWEPVGPTICLHRASISVEHAVPYVFLAAMLLANSMSSHRAAASRSRPVVAAVSPAFAWRNDPYLGSETFMWLSLHIPESMPTPKTILLWCVAVGNVLYRLTAQRKWKQWLPGWRNTVTKYVPYPTVIPRKSSDTAFN
jgi:hypothetical protein